MRADCTLRLQTVPADLAVESEDTFLLARAGSLGSDFSSDFFNFESECAECCPSSSWVLDLTSVGLDLGWIG